MKVEVSNAKERLDEEYPCIGRDINTKELVLFTSKDRGVILDTKDPNDIGQDWDFAISPYNDPMVEILEEVTVTFKM